MLIQAAGFLTKILAKNPEILETRKSSKSRQLDSGPKFWLQIQLPGFEIQAAGFEAKILAPNPAAWICVFRVSRISSICCIFSVVFFSDFPKPVTKKAQIHMKFLLICSHESAHIHVKFLLICSHNDNPSHICQGFCCENAPSDAAARSS